MCPKTDFASLIKRELAATADRLIQSIDRECPIEKSMRSLEAPGRGNLGPKLLLNALEAAELLGVSDTTIRELWGAGHLKFVRIGKGRKVTRAELERFIIEREEAN